MGLAEFPDLRQTPRPHASGDVGLIPLLRHRKNGIGPGASGELMKFLKGGNRVKIAGIDGYQQGPLRAGLDFRRFYHNK